ncbi:free fatty acid receptor 4-like [Lethenteron reissneri]|uniref:free fatty acid receptor 4-like n=1 Tax=Lethenteron reissneri TaxID=7753 RepID=UPI002AB69F1F|nr:free fatty acid receptor 4-like [Lethenteron reissneri]
MVSYFEGEFPRGAPHGRALYFAFFSEFGTEGRGVGLALEAAVMGVVVLVGVAGNAVSLASALRPEASRRGPVGPLLASLAAASLALLGPACVGVAARWTGSWRLGEAACRSVFALLVAGGAATLLTTAAISAARLRALSRGPSRGGPSRGGPCFGGPCRGGSRGEFGAAGVTAGVIWALATLAAIPAALGFTARGFAYGTQEVVVCTLVWPGRGGSLSWVSSMFVLLLLLPAMVMAVSHGRIIQVLRSNRARLHRPPGAPSTARTPEGVSGEGPAAGSYLEAPRDTEDPEAPGPLPPGSPAGFAVAAITRAFARDPAAHGDGRHRHRRRRRRRCRWRWWRRWRWNKRETGGTRATPVPPR